MREIEEDKTDTTNKIFSIRCSSKRHYNQLAEICRNPEIFHKASELIKQEKEEKIRKLCKELQLIDPDMDITPRKNETTEHNDNKKLVIQTQQKPKKIQEHNTKDTMKKKKTKKL